MLFYFLCSNIHMFVFSSWILLYSETNMKIEIGLTLVFIGSAFCSVFQVIHKPKSINLPEQSSFLLSEAPLVASQFLGLSAEKPNGWTGKGDLLKRPECAAMFLVTVPDHLKPEIGAKFSYPLTADDPPSFDEVGSELETYFSGKGFIFMDVSKEVKGSHAVDLNQMIPNEQVKTKFSPLREQLMNMKSVAVWLDKMPEDLKNGVPDFYLFRIDGLLPIIQRSSYAQESEDATKELAETIKEVTDKLRGVYSDNCFVGMVTQGAPHKREKRETETTASSPEDVPGLYDFYKPDYPVAFNIILWTMVFISLTVLFVSVGMWFMDPGKDSIIYRMTMQRAKKD